ncbi:hypothetical protein M201_gp64 [Haloarcula californiae tailed virus 2]|uniref:Uncharacterized protein n=1 Tax=Haloarcula californiae tailed virus 2 TaxID=1273747 RepID=R4TNM4_9CAUD|nr:hypothetical protein M201_gp64 [Haloarcula californiae tailed virus 2]AGM11833.1 hypothetical protein HCTV2_64 [Haloarcula californiae tailed virus 2]
MTDTPEAIGDRAEYERFDSDGLEQCPVCGTSLDSRWHTGRVVQPTGPESCVEYDHLLETDPMDGPFYCGECWDSHLTERREATHRTLSEFGTTDDVYYGE